MFIYTLIILISTGLAANGSVSNLSTMKLLAQATFGAEFTFSNNVIVEAQDGANTVNNPMSEYFRDQLAAKVLERCHGCKAVKGKNQYGIKTYKIIYPDGFYFVVATDPGVVEIQTKPSTVEEIKAQSHRLKSDLFEVAREIGISPGSRGGGHIHMGLASSVGSDLMLMRNLLVDFANHPELAMGILENSPRNAPALALLSQDQQETFAKIIADVDANRIRSVRELALRINEEVYGPDHQKNQALNLMRIANPSWDESERTFEFRAIRPQLNEQEFVLLVRLLEGRLEYLKKIKQPIALSIPLFSKGAVKGADQMIENFTKYLNGTGVDLSEFISTFSLSPRLEQSAQSWIKKQRQPKSCARIY